MNQIITLDNKNYLPASEAARLVGYTSDYVSQLARKGKISAQRIGRLWYVDENALRDFVETTAISKELRMERLRAQRIAELRLHSEVGVRQTTLVYVDRSFADASGLSLKTIALQKLSALVIALAFVGSVSALATTLAWGSTWGVGRIEAQVGAQAVTLARPLVVALESIALSTYRLFTVSIAPVSSTIEMPTVPLLQNGVPATAQKEGIVAFPSSGDARADEAAKNRIKEAFSDSVYVIPDETGRSGMIKPVFRNQSDDAYLYVLVPVAGETQ